jgi:hypothetical protein
MSVAAAGKMMRAAASPNGGALRVSWRAAPSTWRPLFHTKVEQRLFQTKTFAEAVRSMESVEVRKSKREIPGNIDQAQLIANGSKESIPGINRLSYIAAERQAKIRHRVPPLQTHTPASVLKK